MPMNRPRPRRARDRSTPRSTAAAPAPPSRPVPTGDVSSPLPVGAIVRDLRYPLSLIAAYTELLATAPDEPTRARLLDALGQASRQLASALARLEHWGQHRRLFSDGGEHPSVDER